MMQLDCRRCGSPIPLPAEDTLSATTVVACPNCGTKYARRSGPASVSTLAPAASSPATPSAPAPAPAPVNPQDPTQILGQVQEATLFRPNEVISERYRIRRFIARGGMGEVYEAEDLELRQPVALKTVHPRDATHELASERFKREIYLARKVTHPNVCRIYDVGHHGRQDGSSVIYLTMELLAGETLSQRIRRQGTLTAEESLPIARQMMAALAAAHAAGVIHRDFKSENVFLVPAAEGTRVVVTDFGVARGVEYDQFAAQVTVVDAAVGTPAYMAPEQIEGGAITAAIDQYALGVVLFEMVTGDLPFAGDTPLATAVKRLTSAPPSPEELVPGLDPLWIAVIRRCLARYPADRFPSVLEADKALAGESSPLPVSEPTERDPKRRKQLRLLAAISLLLLFAVIQAIVRVRHALESPFAGESGEIRRAVAVVPFRNLAQRPELEWLSVALAEMVASELRAGEGLRTVASDDVARARVDLGLAGTDQPSDEVISTLRSRLGTDFVVLGSYTVLGSGATASVRLAVRIEDAGKRETLGEAVETGGEEQLFHLVSRLGERLRQLLGSAARDSKPAVIATSPTHPRAAKLYSEGLLKLRAFEPSAARELLEQAAAAEPGHPMIRAALAQTWSALGFEQRAEQEAAKALEQGAGLPPEERFVVEGLSAELHRDWPRAQEIYAKLWTAFPDNLEYGLKLARAQLDVGRPETALLTIASLRALPAPEKDNPRIDLAEAATALALSDFSRQRDAAARAGRKAAALNAPLLVAEARVREAEALRRLGDSAGAAMASEASRQLYVAAGDRVGEASALMVAAGALFDRGDLAAARDANERALARYREAGDRGGVARSLNSLAVLARNLGDLPRARTLYEQALQVLAEVGDLGGTAYTRNNLAAAIVEEGRLAEARNAVTAALAVFRQLKDQSGVADALLNLGTIERQQGELGDAKAHLEEARALKRDLGQKPGEAAALAALGGLAIDRGELAEAQASLGAAAKSARETASKAVLSNALAALAEADLEAGDFASARGWAEESLALRRALRRAGKIDESRLLLARIALENGEIRAVVSELEKLASESSPGRSPDLAAAIAFTSARAYSAWGRVGEARAALARGVAFTSATENLQVKLMATAAALTTEISGARPATDLVFGPGEAVAMAKQHGFGALALELDLLRLRAESRKGGGAEAIAAMRRISTEATSRGLLRVAHLAAVAAGSS